MSQPMREPSKRIKMRAQKIIIDEVPKRSKKSAEGTSKSKGKRVTEEEPPSDNTPLFTEEVDWMEFHAYNATRTIVGARYTSITWLESVNHFVAATIKSNNLEKLLDTGKTFYPNLTRAFYNMLCKDYDSAELSATVKGVKMLLSKEVWEEMFDLKNTGFRANKAALQHMGIEYNKSEVFRSMMKNPTDRIGSRLSVSQLRIEWRIIHYLLTWVILPRGSNHAQVFEDDLIVMWFMQQRQEINWIHMIEENMLKARRLADSALPYATVIAQFIHRFNVPHGTEIVETVREECEFKDKHIRQMGYVKRDNIWFEKGSNQGEPEPEAEEEEGGGEPTGAAEMIISPAEPPQSELLYQILGELKNLNTKHDQLREEMINRFDSISKRLDELGAQESSEDEIES